MHELALAAASPPTQESLPDDPGTRQRLLEAALMLFGERGLDGVSTRELAEVAGVNLAAIPYHFTSKEGLYRAVAQYLVEKEVGPVRAFIETAEQSLREQRLSAREAAALLRDLIKAVGQAMLLNPKAVFIVSYIAREQLKPTAAFDHLYDSMISRVHNVLARLVAAIERAPEPDQRCILRAHCIIGQLIGFNVGRETAFRRLGWDSYTPQRVEAVVGELADFVFTGLGRPRARERRSRPVSMHATRRKP